MATSRGAASERQEAAHRVELGLQRALEQRVARRRAVDIAEASDAAGRRRPRDWPSRSRGRARSAAARSSRACASAPACTPRSGRPSPRAARSAGGPRRSDRTARAAAPRRALRGRPRAGPRRPASTSRGRRRVHAPSRALARSIASPSSLAVLRHGVAQAADQGRQRRRRQRRVLAHDDVDERIDPGAPRRRMARLRRRAHAARRRGCRCRAGPRAAGRGSACRRAGGWSRSTSRPSSW